MYKRRYAARQEHPADLVIHLVLEVTVVSGIDHLLSNTVASLVIGILLVEGAQHLLGEGGR